MPAFTLHDLRRSVATGMARLGVQLPVIEKVLNHVTGSFAGIVGVYQRHEFSAEKKRALEQWGEHVESLTSNPRKDRGMTKLAVTDFGNELGWAVYDKEGLDYARAHPEEGERQRTDYIWAMGFATE